MRKFFLYDKAERSMVTPNTIAEKSGQIAFNLETEKSTSLDGAYLFTEETLSEMGIKKTSSMLEIPVTQSFLNDIPYPVNDTAPQFDADDSFSWLSDKTKTIQICPLGVIAVDEENRTFEIKSPDLSEATPITNERIQELGLEGQLKEVGGFSVEWGMDKYFLYDIYQKTMITPNMIHWNDDARRWRIDFSKKGTSSLKEAYIFTDEFVEQSQNNVSNDWRVSDDATKLRQILKEYDDSRRHVSDDDINDLRIPTSADEMDLESTIIKVYINQEFLNTIDYAVQDTTPRVDAEDQVPKTNDDDFVVAVCAEGVISFPEADEDRKYHIQINPPDMKYATLGITNKEIRRRGLDKELAAVGALRSRYDEYALSASRSMSLHAKREMMDLDEALEVLSNSMKKQKKYNIEIDSEKNGKKDGDLDFPPGFDFPSGIRM